MLEVNDILVAAPDTSTLVEGYARLVGVDDQNHAYLIRMDKDPLTSPFRVSMPALLTAIHKEEVLLDHESEIVLPPTLESVSVSRRKIANDAMTLLAPIVSDEDLLFDSEYRGRIFKKRANECDVSQRTIRRLYYQYLWGGQTELALIPELHKRGGRGNKQLPGTARRGPKAEDQSTANLVPLPEVRDKLKNGATLFYFSGGRTIEEAFMATKEKYFRKKARLEKRGNVIEILLPDAQLPSLGQFRYVSDQVRKEKGITRKLGRPRLKKISEWKFRGQSRDNVPGPGFRFEIDATKVQIRLASRYNRNKVLKNATLYVVIDVWSGAIVGYALSLHNASWALAARALHNCFTDKQEVFDRLGLEGYTSEDWPCHHLPGRIAADRGEMVSNKAGLVPEIGIKVEIMPPMCPQRKGKVESAIKDIKHGHSYKIPGKHPKIRQRRETDGTDTAALTIDELEKIIVDIIMGLNHDPVPASYIPPEFVESGETDVTHVGLYRWGIENLCGHTRKLNKTEVYTGLMLKGVAIYRADGLYFKCQTFSAPELAYAVTYKSTSGRSKILVDIRYDEHQADRVWFLDNRTNTWVPAINENENTLRRKAGFYELEILRKQIQKLRRAVKDQSLFDKNEKRKEIDERVKEAEQQTREDRAGLSQASRKKNTTETTQIEKEVAALIATGLTNTDNSTSTEFEIEDVTNQQGLQSEAQPSQPPESQTDKAGKSTNRGQSIAQICQQTWEE